MNAALRGYLRHRGGNITAGIYDVRSGRTCLYRPGAREHTASIVKVDILATLLHQTQSRGGLGGQALGIAQGMIEGSDNDDATDLWNQEGGAPAVQAFDAKAGMTQTTPNVTWGLTTTNPRDQLKLLSHRELRNRHHPADFEGGVAKLQSAQGGGLGGEVAARSDVLVAERGERNDVYRAG